jgi:hypothetical protein
MAKLRELIDFEYFNQDNFESISDNEDKYIIGKENDMIPYYIDHLVEHNKSDRKFVNDQINNYIKFIEIMLSHDLNGSTKLKDIYILSDSPYYKKDHFVTYKMGNYYIMFMRLEYEDESKEISLTGIIHNNLDKPKYIFIGSESENYFIHTDTFSYADSSGIAESSGYIIDPENWNGYSSNNDDDDDNKQDPNVFLSSKSNSETILISLKNTLVYIQDNSVNKSIIY